MPIMRMSLIYHCYTIVMVYNDIIVSEMEKKSNSGSKTETILQNNIKSQSTMPDVLCCSIGIQQKYKVFYDRY